MDQMLFYNVIDFYRKSHSVKILGKYYNVPAVDDISVSIAELRKKYEVSSTCLIQRHEFCLLFGVPGWAGVNIKQNYFTVLL